MQVGQPSTVDIQVLIQTLLQFLKVEALPAMFTKAESPKILMCPVVPQDFSVMHRW